MMALLAEVKKDKDYMRHYQHKVRKGLLRLETMRRAVIAMNPGYRFRVKLPYTPLPVHERLAVVGSRANYGHHTKFAWKIIKGNGPGTFDELRKWAVENALLRVEDRKVAEGLRQALYGMARRNQLATTVREDGKIVFAMNDPA